MADQWDVCKEHFETLSDKLDEISKGQEDMHKRLFVDNGRQSYQTRLGKVESFVKVHLWVYITIAAALIGAVIKVYMF